MSITHPLTYLDPIDPVPLDPDVVAAAQRHPMRTVTYAAAAEVGAWSGDTPAQVQSTFDDLAGEWHTKHGPDSLAAVADAVHRGGLTAREQLAHLHFPDQRTDRVPWWLELGAGDGWASSLLSGHAPCLLAADLSAQMLAHSPSDGVLRVQADAAALPLDDNSVTVAVLINMLLFPNELDRVIAPGGSLLWLSSRGPATPIHLTADQVTKAMPGRWGGVASGHGTATWSVLHRLG